MAARKRTTGAGGTTATKATTATKKTQRGRRATAATSSSAAHWPGPTATPTIHAAGDGARAEVEARRAGGTERILNCLPSPDQADDWGFASAAASGLVAARGPLPTSVDRRADWWKIGNQGSTGSCVGWATADSVLRWHLVDAGRIGPNEKLSVRFVWMAAKETDEFSTRPTTFIEPEGTSLKAALDVARKYGVVRDRDLPFARPKLFGGDAKAFYLLASQLKIAAYVNLGRDLKDWCRWLATNGPILTRLTCDDTWMNAKSTNGELAAYDWASASGGHAVALVGYTQDHFIVRNSWGVSTWGDKGFAYASYPYAADAFTEAYGVSVV
ncbi:MAG TPA: C1 family peptidase [Acidimicrobiales bacterium]|nr:C1 family peptidase [Acidimicrobiales bacterium]